MSDLYEWLNQSRFMWKLILLISIFTWLPVADQKRKLTKFFIQLVSSWLKPFTLAFCHKSRVITFPYFVAISWTSPFLQTVKWLGELCDILMGEDFLTRGLADTEKRISNTRTLEVTALASIVLALSISLRSLSYRNIFAFWEILVSSIPCQYFHVSVY